MFVYLICQKWKVSVKISHYHIFSNFNLSFLFVFPYLYACLSEPQRKKFEWSHTSTPSAELLMVLQCPSFLLLYVYSFSCSFSIPPTSHSPTHIQVRNLCNWFNRCLFVYMLMWYILYNVRMLFNFPKWYCSLYRQLLFTFFFHKVLCRYDYQFCCACCFSNLLRPSKYVCIHHIYPFILSIMAPRLHSTPYSKSEQTFLYTSFIYKDDKSFRRKGINLDGNQMVI